MKKFILTVGVLFTLSAFMQSCAPTNGVQRPNRHPMTPKPMAMTTHAPNNAG